MTKRLICDFCDESYEKNNFINHLKSQQHIKKLLENCELQNEFKVVEVGFKCRLATFILENCEKVVMPEEFLRKNSVKIIDLIKNCRDQHTSIKINLDLHCDAHIPAKQEEETTINFVSGNVLITKSMNINEKFLECVEKIKKKSLEFELKNSGWSIDRVKYVIISINKACIVGGGSYIPTPKVFENKYAIVNIKGSTPYCFFYCLLAYFLNKKNPKTDHLCKIAYLRKGELLLENHFPNFKSKFSFPIKLTDIKKIEKEYKISINVFYWTSGSKTITGPVHLTEKEMPDHVNLLLLNDNENYHYVWIKNMSRLISRQISKHDGAKHLCNACLLPFANVEKLNAHKSRNECFETITSLPSKENAILKFSSYGKLIEVNFCFYADFESILKKLDGEQDTSSSDKTLKTHLHQVSAAGYYICSNKFKNENAYKSFWGEDSIDQFLDSIFEDCKRLYNQYLTKSYPISNLTMEQVTDFNDCTNCWICRKEFLEGEIKCLDHDHTQELNNYLGAAHSRCNILRRRPLFHNIIFHGASNYDFHFIFEKICDRKDVAKIDAIAQNNEKFIALYLTIKNSGNNNFQVRIIDSFRFMSSSLENITKTLPKTEFHHLEQQFKYHPSCDLLKMKNFYPYEYMDSYEKLNETCLPPISSFYSTLTNSQISEENYEHAQKVWRVFGCKTLLDFTLLYLKVDCMILCCCSEFFRKRFLKDFNLDPFQYTTLASLSFDAMLLYTNVEIALFTDHEMLHMLTSSMRGGIVDLSKRYAKANNKYLSDYDKTKKTSFVIYADFNALYATCLSRPLPVRNFVWDDPSYWTRERILELSPTAPIGYIFEVDLIYPPECHPLHDQFPFCPTHSVPPGENNSVKKLLLTLYDKNNYAMHYLMLQECLRHNLVLKKVHRVIRFEQEAFMKPYVDFFTKKRMEADNDFDKDLAKLSVNVLYGKSCENLLKYKNIKFVRKIDNKETKQFNIETLCSNPLFESFKIVNENLAIVFIKKEIVVYNKPISIGFAVLELSKLMNYDFFYNYLVPKYPEEGSLVKIYQDTDSFVFQVYTDDFYEDMKPDIQKFYDTSNFDVNNRFGIVPQNKKVLGLLKIETGQFLINEFVGLRSKMYAINVENDSDIKKAKGVLKHLVQSYTVDLYKNILFNKEEHYDVQTKIRSYNHKVYTEKVKKLALSSGDNKRKVLENNIDTISWGHFKLTQK